MAGNRLSPRALVSRLNTLGGTRSADPVWLRGRRL